MSGTTRPVKLRVEAEEVNRARQDLERLGADGDRALKRIGTASVAAQPGIQGLAAASDGAVRAFGSLGVSAGGLERVFAGVGSGASGAAAGMAAIGAAALAAGVGIARAGDEYVGVVSRLASATGSLQGAQRAYEGLFKLSQQTGASVAESAGAFSRLAVAAKEIGATNDQVLKLVAGIQKAGIVAGTSAEEAGAAVQQLGQALASGVLQGDELRSLLENMPQLAQLLARELGVGIGQLRQMGAEGKLTADKVFPALLAASEKMNAEFEKMPPTMGRAFGILGAAMQDFAARLDQALGLSQAIAAAAIKAANAVNAVKQGVVPNEWETARTGVEREKSAIARLQARIADAEESIQQQMQSGLTREQATDLMLPVGPGEKSLSAQLAEREKALQGHYRNLKELNEDYQQSELLETIAAENKRAQVARDAAEKGRKALMAEHDERYKIFTKYQEAVKAVEENFAKGGLTTSERDLLLHNLSTKMEEDIKKVGEAAKHATEAVKGLMEVWETPQLNFKTGLLSFSEGDNRLQEQIKKNLAKAAEEASKANEHRTKEAEKEAERVADRSQKITDDIVQYSAERFGDLFSETGRGWNGLMDSMKKTAISTFGRIVAEAALRPIVQPIVGAFLGITGGAGGSGIAGGSAGAAGGGGILSSLSSLSSLGNLSGLGSLFGAGGGISSFLSTPLWGGSIAGPVTAGGLAASGAPTIGGLLGGVGLGFGAGTLLNSFLGGNQLGGMGGAGLGALGGFLIGGPIGGLLGGLLGGGVGGLFGPGKKHHGWSYTVDGNTANGLLDIKWPAIDDVAREQFAQEAAQIAQVNAWLKSNKISTSGVYVVGGNNDPNIINDYDSFGAGFSNLRFSAANDDSLNSALSGRMFGGADQLADFVGVVRDLIPALSAAPVSEFAAALKSLNATYDAAIAKAQEYALAEDGLTAERNRRIADLTARRDLQAAGITAGLSARFLRATGQGQSADLLAFDQAAAEERVQLRAQIDALGMAGTQYAADRIVQIEETLAAERLAIVERYATDTRSAGQSLLMQLAIGNTSALAPEQQYFAGLTVLNSARARLDAGGALADFTSVASQILPVARDFLGTSERYAALVADIAGVVSSKGGDPAGLSALLEAQVNGTDALRDVFASYGQQQLGVASATLTEIRRLASSLEAYIARQMAA